METGNKISEIKQPLISVIVPAYNIEQYIGDCIESILAQSYDNIEIVVVNDGSVDQTGVIVEKYKKDHPEKVKCIHVENGGVMNARMTGIKAATGEWIGFVDGDDTIEPDMYRRLMENAILYKAEISHCGYRTIVNGGERVHYFYNTGRLVQQDGITGLKDLLSGSFVEPGLWNKLFHKTLFHSLLHDDTFPKDIRINEDLLMNYYLFKEARKSVYEDFCPYNYMTRSTSATRSEFKAYKVLDPIKVRRIILDDAAAEMQDIAWQKYLVTKLNACIALHGKKEHESLCKHMKTELKINRSKWHLLRKNDLIKLQIFLLSGTVYKLIFNIYEKYIQKKIYE